MSPNSISSKENGMDVMNGETVAITGISGRYPESWDINEFWSNLFSRRDLCTSDDRRWPVGYLKLPEKTGKIPGLEKFDAEFFGLSDDDSNKIESQYRVWHEATYGAIIDAGLDPDDVCKSDRTGLFIGVCYSDGKIAMARKMVFENEYPRTGEIFTASNVLNIKGPFTVYDSACASSQSAIVEAFHAIRANIIDTAIISGIGVSTYPFNASCFRLLGMNSLDGKSYCMDERARGYARSETVASIVLQKESVSKRVYAKIRNSKSRSDGYKVEGIVFPGMKTMMKLMKETYDDAKIDPAKTKYIEAHVTGTQAGDPIECRAIENIFCPNSRKDAILVGCLKSNMGHAEGASGIAALTKACLIIQKRMIPPNINFEKPNPNISGLMNGKLQPVLEVTPFDHGIISVGSAGFGGTNAHTILQSYDEVNNENIDILTGLNGINRLILFKARTEQSFEYLKNQIINDPNDITTEYLDLIDNISCLNDEGNEKFPIRGFFILDNDKRILHHDWVDIRKNVFPLNKTNILLNELDRPDSIKLSKNISILLQKANVSDFSIRRNADLVWDEHTIIRTITESLSGDEILKVIGTYFIKNPSEKISIKNLYPTIKYPVSKTTASISPLLKWDHGKDRTVHKVPDYFKFSSQSRLLHFDYATRFNYLRGHVIDGRIIFPATQYLWAVWQTLTMEKIHPSGEAFLSSGIKFLDVKFDQAIIADGNEEVDLIIRMDSVTGFFEIIHNQISVCTGYAMLTYGQKVPSIISSFGDGNKPLLEKEDFYKEIRVRGYDYEGDFKGVDSCKIDGSGGTVSFIRNWVCFADSILQLSLIDVPERSLRVPTGIEFMQIDPNVFKDFTSIEYESYKAVTKSLTLQEVDGMEYLDGTIGLDEDEDEEKKAMKQNEIHVFKVDICKLTDEIFTDGLYIKGLKTNPIPRRKISPFVGKFYSCPLNESFEREHIHAKKELYETHCLDMIKMNDDRGNNNFFESDKISTDFKNPSEHSLFSALKKLKAFGLYWRNHILNYSTELSNDLLTTVPIDVNESATFHQLSIVTENGYGSHIKVTEINTSSKCSLRNQVESVLNETRWTASYSSFMSKIDCRNPNDDANYVDKYMTERKIDSKLVIVQHPSLGMQFLDSRDCYSRRIDEYTGVIGSTFRQVSFGAYIMVLFRIDDSNVEKKITTDNHFPFPEKSTISDQIKSSGWVIVSTKSIGSYVSILGRKVDPETIMKNRQVFEVESFNYNWVEEIRDKVYKTVIKNGSEMKEPTNNDPIWIICRGTHPSGLYGLIRTLNKEDKRFRGIQINGSMNPKSCINYDSIFDTCVKYDLVISTVTDGRIGTFMCAPFSDMSNGYRSNDSNKKTVTCCLDIESKGDLSSLKYYEKSIQCSEDSIVDIYYAALNFKDIMVSTGRVTLEAYPEFFRGGINQGNIGMEFSGKTNRGKRVMGMAISDAIATKIDTSSYSDFMFNVPDWMTLEEAATIPVAYLTAYYALLIRGKLMKGESILIHAGSGGVGQASINICQSLGCEIYTTVGTKEKREFIKGTFSIPDDHIFDSRSTSFGDGIIRATNGRGVDVVLNSLSDEKLQVGLTCLAVDGRFLEIGKYDMLINSPIDPSSLAANQTYQSICIAYLMDRAIKKSMEKRTDSEVVQLRNLIESGLINKVIKPLTRHLFEWDQPEEAFRYMATGNHIGKVLIKIRDDISELNTIEPNFQCNVRPSKVRVSFDPEKSYLVIGGLGGMGLEFCHWLVSKGVKNLIITSRTGIRTRYQSYCIDRLKQQFGASVTVVNYNIANLKEAKELVNCAQSFGPLGGIFNLGMVLKEALFENQSKEKFEQCCNIKIQGTYNLDQVTKFLCPSLDHFVVFSSLAATYGNEMQSNYSFANSFMEELMRNRRKDGLPGLSVAFGLVADVGFAAEKMGHIDNLLGCAPQRIFSCWEVMESVLHSNEPVVLTFKTIDRNSTTTSPGKSNDLKATILNVLGSKDHSSIDPKSTLASLGLDSLMAVEIKQTLETKYDVMLSAKDIRALTVEKIDEISKEVTNIK